MTTPADQHRRRLATVTTVAASVVLLGPGTVPPAGAALERSCGEVAVTLSPGDTRWAYRIEARGVPCAQARRLARAVTADPGEGGTYLTFRCGGSSVGISCVKGAKRVRRHV